jgi:hypothetical protein
MCTVSLAACVLLVPHVKISPYIESVAISPDIPIIISGSPGETAYRGGDTRQRGKYIETERKGGRTKVEKRKGRQATTKEIKGE